MGDFKKQGDPSNGEIILKLGVYPFTDYDAWSYGRVIEIKSNFSRKKLHRTNEGSNFLGGSFSNRDNVRAPIQFGRESRPQHLKR